MADITKRISKKIADRLAPGEVLQIAILVEPKGTYGTGMVGLVVAPGLQMRRLRKQAQESREDEGGMAATFPTKPCVVAVTNHRIHVVDSNGLSFKETLLEVPLGSMLVGDVDGIGIGNRIRFVFADGTSVIVDAQRGQPLEELADILGRAG